MGVIASAVEQRCVAGCSDKKQLYDEGRRNKRESNTKLITDGANTTDEQNSKLTNIITEMNEKMEVQRVENEALKKQLDEYKESQNEQNTLKQQLASLQMKLDMMEYTKSDNMSQQNEMEQENENISDGLDVNDQSLRRIVSHEKDVSEHRVKHTLEKSKNGEDVASIVLAKYKSANVYTEGDMIDFEEEQHTDSESSSFEEHEKLEIDQRKSFVMKTKSLEEEENAMRKEMEYLYKDKDGDTLNMNDITNDNEKRKFKVTVTGINDPSNLFRDESSAKWDPIQVSKQKQEMQAHMIHLVRSHTESSTPDISPKDISSLQ